MSPHTPLFKQLASYRTSLRKTEVYAASFALAGTLATGVMATFSAPQDMLQLNVGLSTVCLVAAFGAGRTVRFLDSLKIPAGARYSATELRELERIAKVRLGEVSGNGHRVSA